MRRNDGKPNGKTSPRMLALREKAMKALELRKSGLTYDRVAEEAGYNSPQAAHDAVKRLLNQAVREASSDLIKLELERLDALWELPYIQAQGGDAAALASCMRLMDRRAKLLGLDAPQRKEVSGPHGGAIQTSATIAQIDTMTPEDATRLYMDVMAGRATIAAQDLAAADDETDDQAEDEDVEAG